MVHPSVFQARPPQGRFRRLCYDMMLSKMSLHWDRNAIAAAQGTGGAHEEAGLRAIAAFEAAKGLVVLIVGFGLLEFLHLDIEEAAENLLLRVHVSPERHLARVFLDLAARLTGPHLVELAAAAAAYSAVRFVEAFGLWRRHAWAQWFALVSCALYLPWEIWELVRRVNWIHAAIVAGNVLILIYLLRLRVTSRCRGGAPA
jgi:uncharacterized membrane protein (DUF2068 family)